MRCSSVSVVVRQWVGQQKACGQQENFNIPSITTACHLFKTCYMFRYKKNKISAGRRYLKVC